MTSSFGQLKQAQNRFADCIESCKAVDASNKDKTILVPLTSSLYVPGKLANVEKVIVDIGTGYYVEKVRQELQRTIFFFTLPRIQPLVVRHRHALSRQLEQFFVFFERVD